MILCEPCAAPTDERRAIRQDGRCAVCEGEAGPFYYCPDPICCRWCRAEDPNVMLHANNHGGAMGLREGHCMAQHLRRNHLRFIVAPDRGTAVPARNAKNIREYLDRFLEVWAHMPRELWAAEVEVAEQRLHLLETPVEPPAHHAVPESEQIDLFGGAA